jgi:hypothetical protein
MMRTQGKWRVDTRVEYGEYGSIICKYISGISSSQGTICEFVDDYGTDIAANAQFICKAVNCHDEMVEALAEIRTDSAYAKLRPFTREKIREALKKVQDKEG